MISTVEAEVVESVDEFGIKCKVLVCWSSTVFSSGISVVLVDSVEVGKD